MYVLTQEEYDDLKRVKQDELDSIKQQYQVEKRKDSIKHQKLMTQIADTMPIKYWGRNEASPWRCIITVAAEAKKRNDPEEGDSEWYCDECPVKSLCCYPYQRSSK
jgi:hypothetical protein